MALESLVIFNIITTTESCKEIFATLFLGLQGAKQKVTLRRDLDFLADSFWN